MGASGMAVEGLAYTGGTQSLQYLIDKFQFSELFGGCSAPSLPLMREVAKIFDFRRRERNIY